ncbi:MAG: HIT domain-containing protein, partial [Bacilli bacterium]|nr:HIT domain-containing protein [Bacilli bacterium]
KLYEDEYTYAFMDIANDIDGHILVIPKKHVTNVLDCDEATLSQVMATVKKISILLVDKCGYDGVNVLNASGECAGQTVFHLHFHIIPKKKNDGISAWPKLPGGKDGVEATYKKIMNAINE